MPGRGLRLLASLAAVAVLAGCTGVGTSTAPQSTTSPTSEPTIVPVPSDVPTPSQTVEPTVGEPEAFVPPDPGCPAPLVGLEPPRLVATVGGVALPVIMGPAGVLTCSTSRSDEGPAPDPSVPLTATAGGSVRFELPPGWRYLSWEGWDRPVDQEGANVIVGAAPADRPTWIEVPVPARPGDSVLGISAWTISGDERTLSSITGAILVRLP
ncbi:MAG: hypothetical protein ABIV26_02115 [Candidatus Limnocylindrales bacterium]